MVYKTKDTEAGIWAPSGLAVTPDGHLLASVGNSGHTSASQGFDESDAILSLSPTLHLDDYFAPTSWAADNAADLDLSSMGPAYLPDSTRSSSPASAASPTWSTPVTSGT